MTIKIVFKLRDLSAILKYRSYTAKKVLAAPSPVDVDQQLPIYTIKRPTSPSTRG